MLLQLMVRHQYDSAQHIDIPLIEPSVQMIEYIRFLMNFQCQDILQLLRLLRKIEKMKKRGEKNRKFVAV